jgi:hypothetical protein
MQCPPCKGKGRKPSHTLTKCELCKGVGLLPDDRLNNPPCAFCSGTGILPGHVWTLCSICHGWGRLPDDLAGPFLAKSAQHDVLAVLRSTLTNIPSQLVCDFVDEAIGCAEAKFFRAAIVLSWAGAVRVLQEYVVTDHLDAFNAEATRRDSKWRPAKNADDLSRMKEYDFLQILEAISIIGKSVKSELEGCLKLRNGASHPSTLQVSEHRTAAHIETLVLNVFSVFI